MALSIIDVGLWDKAKWGGIGFAYAPGHPPIMGFLFKDFEAGKKIFQRWKTKFGAVDAKNEIRITIIQGISVTNPAYYKVVVTNEIPPASKVKGKIISGVTRYNVMTPENPHNFAQFLKLYAQHGSFGIAPGLMDPTRIRSLDMSKLSEKISFI